MKETSLFVRIKDTFSVLTVDGMVVPLCANRAQRAFEAQRGQRNIVMKSRQQGITTWCIARALLRCVDNPQSLAVSAFQDVNAANHAIHLIRAMLELAGVAHSYVTTSVTLANGSRYHVMAATASRFELSGAATIHRFHGSEVAMWPGNPGYELLAEARNRMAPDAEETLESYPSPSDEGLFRGEWQVASERGVVRHFLPWWINGDLVDEAPATETLTDVECGLIIREGLTLNQIGFRRKLISRGYFPAVQETAIIERPGGCYLEKPVE